jgi:hypothetical protein
MTATTAPAKPASLWEDFIDIFYAPTSVFLRRREGKFGIALLVYVLLATGMYTFSRPLMAPIFDAMTSQREVKMRRDNPQVTEEQLAAGRRIQEKFTSGGVGIAIAAISQTVIVLVVGFLIWLVAKMFGGQATLGQASMVATYAFFPRLLGFVVGAALLYVTPPEQLTSMASMSLSPGRFVDAQASPVLAAFLSRIDLFVLWGTVVLGIGIAVVGKIERGKGIAAAFVVWLIATIAAVGQIWAATA